MSNRPTQPNRRTAAHADDVAFRCRLKERDITVINNGKCTLAA